MDNRLHKINSLLREYSKGNFERRIRVSDSMDEIDACITSINMLGEELREATISRNYFNNIFNSVTDMVFVLDKRGLIKDINLSVSLQLKYDKENLTNKPIEKVLAADTKSFFNSVIQHLRTDNNFSKNVTFFKSSDGIKVPVQLNASWLISSENKPTGILLLAKNITAQLETENILLRAIIDTEEKERQRLARDLHDSLGQQLSAIKFFISASAETAENNSQKQRLNKCNTELANVLAEMRAICFNLIPKTLKEFGLIKAIKELCIQVARNNKIDFKIMNENSIPDLPIDMAIDIFRIIQEFINNAQRHGKANKIKIIFFKSENNVSINLKDNGIGFIQSKSTIKTMGLQNITSRVKSHNGEITVRSVVGKGTEYSFSLPIKLLQCE